MIRFSTPRQPRRGLVSLTPLVDVVFILLIFFMLASSFNDWSGIRINLPPAGTSGGEEQNPVVLTLTSENGILFEGEILAGIDLASRLGAVIRADPGRRIIVQVGTGVTLQDSIDLLDMIDSLGGSDALLVEHTDGEGVN